MFGSAGCPDLRMEAVRVQPSASRGDEEFMIGLLRSRDSSPSSSTLSDYLKTIGLILVCGSLLLAASPLSGGELQEGKTVGFAHPLGAYTAAKAQQDFGNATYTDLKRADIVDLGSGQKGLRITTRAKTYGWLASGAHLFSKLPPREEYTLEYDVRFGDEKGEKFDFRRGGKLPGLAGGKATSGGRKPQGDGWTVRYMWRDEGHLVVYAYHMDITGKYGDDFPLKIQAKKGQWYKLSMTVRVNGEGKSDGLIRVRVDGKEVLDKTGLRFRSGRQAPVDCFFFAHFWGGQDPSWAPTVDSETYFRRFVLKSEPERAGGAR